MKLKLSEYTDIMTLVANVGVLIGVIFLIVQIQQANQIASRDSRDGIVDSHIQNYGLFLENPDLATLLEKLSSTSPELTDLEKIQASLIAGNQFYVWSKTNVGATTGLLPEANELGQINLARDFIKTYPGLVPYIEDVLTSSGTTKELRRAYSYGIYDAIWEEIDAINK